MFPFPFIVIPVISPSRLSLLFSVITSNNEIKLSCTHIRTSYHSINQLRPQPEPHGEINYTMDKIIGKIADKVEEHQNRHSQAKIDQQVPIPRREGGHGIDIGSSSGHYGGGSGFSHQDDMDLRGAADHAASYPNMNESPEFFSGILDQLGSKKQHVAAQERIDEQEAIAHHRAYYPESSNSSSAQTSSSIPSGPPPSYKEATSQSMGTAAALQALKLFTSSGPSAIPSAVGSSYTPTSSFSPNSNTLGPSAADNTRSGSGGGGGKIAQTAQSILIGLAMNQAAKLFEQQASRGNLEAGASKESAVMKAGEMALRLFLQSQRDSGPGSKYPAAGAGMPLGGGGNQGGHAGLLSLAQRMMAA
ncbi:hypothetical protein QBC37DRAFT_431281 [Rhypophila decipiens]|uniref:DUF7721 domain-containing protein n=1 Tax=Rhypophila decipiens TaxID=261697 RepID=A0AAN6XY78_9PEZI|nr:hypothetical protein QBC37DRAFT_431281 [Rhypophila decipiens]